MRMLFILGMITAKVWACSCAVSLTGTPPCQSAWAHSAVFTGSVQEITEPSWPLVPMPPASPQTATPPSARRTADAPPLTTSFPQRKVRFKITEVLTGLDPSQKEIVIATGLGGGDCGYGFQRGVEYIVYASNQREDGLSTGICSPTRPIEQAAEDLKYFRQLANAAAVSEIRVTAFDPYAQRLRLPSGQPQVEGMPKVQVIIDGPGGRQSATTDASGRHVFGGLPPGEYRVAASLEGYASLTELLPVRVHTKGCAEVPLPMRLDRRVGGIVRTSDGQPAPGVTLECVPVRPRHENDMPNAIDSATTDANGRYELNHLTTGDYYFGVSLSRSPKLENPYTRWFYPGTERPAEAGIIHVSDRRETQSFDLVLPRRQGDRIIQGAVFWPDGRMAEGVRIHLEDPRWPWQIFTVSTISDRQGRFILHGLDGTRYRIHAVACAGSPTSAEPITIELGDNPLDLKLILIRKGDSARQLVGTGLEDWRKGLGLR